jgi:peptidoglycan/xylan/chitin deacetylase (PgdA/CDA1 family)
VARAERKEHLMISRPNALALGYAATTAASVGLFDFSLASIGWPTAVLATLIADGVARPGSGVFYPTISHGPRDRPRVALTFDDGPDPEVTPRVLDALAAGGAHATFFVIGRALEAHPALARRIVAEGHELANHSYRHSRFQNFFGQRRQDEEIGGGEAAIRKFSQQGEILFRSPVGLKSPPLAEAARRRGLQIVAWSLHSRDTRLTQAGVLAQRVLQRVRAGDIVLFHDGHDLPGRHRPGCADALPAILEGLKQRRLESVTVSELLASQS